MNERMIRTVISGGQTGVDRAALDTALWLGIEHAGWCPKGRLAEDGPIDLRYLLEETESTSYPIRTERNVVDSDGTLILYRETISGGTGLTCQLATKHCKPLLTVDLDDPPADEKVWEWFRENGIERLNIAGSRESQQPGIADAAAWYLRRILETA